MHLHRTRVCPNRIPSITVYSRHGARTLVTQLLFHLSVADARCVAQTSGQHASPIGSAVLRQHVRSRVEAETPNSMRFSIASSDVAMKLLYVQDFSKRLSVEWAEEGSTHLPDVRSSLATTDRGNSVSASVAFGDCLAQALDRLCRTSRNCLLSNGLAYLQSYQTASRLSLRDHQRRLLTVSYKGPDVIFSLMVPVAQLVLYRYSWQCGGEQSTLGRNSLFTAMTTDFSLW